MLDNPIEVAAFYFPQFHQELKNDEWHGKGWTEWELLKHARPRFEGHRQPIVPKWGYFDESDPIWAAREIDLASDHGITTFLYDWYWYEGKPFLEKGLERGFLKASNTKRLKFALMWANHHWKNYFPTPLINQPQQLASGHVTPDGFKLLTQYVIEYYFSQPNYLKIDGEPLFTIYEIATFIQGIGGVDAAAEAFVDFRTRVKKAGHQGLHLNVIAWDEPWLESELKIKDSHNLIDRFGICSLTSYTWGSGPAAFPKGAYKAAAEASYAAWDASFHRYAVPYYPNVSMGWDPSPRCTQSDHYEDRGYPWTPILTDNTPDLFQDALKHARDKVKSLEPRHRMITINAWNEWTEGSYLLPDTINGNAYLEAIKAVFR